MVLYILPGYTNFGPIVDRIGKVRMGKSCLYLKRLSDVDMTAVEDLIRAGIADLATRWPLSPD